MKGGDVLPTARVETERERTSLSTKGVTRHQPSLRPQQQGLHGVFRG